MYTCNKWILRQVTYNSIKLFLKQPPPNSERPQDKPNLEPFLEMFSHTPILSFCSLLCFFSYSSFFLCFPSPSVSFFHAMTFMTSITHEDYSNPEITLKDSFESQIFLRWAFSIFRFSSFFLEEECHSHWAVGFITFSENKNKRGQVGYPKWWVQDA